VTAADVAIVGAGPAGAWAARKLARAGARVTIFDPSHPREKPCGGGLTGRAVGLIVNELGALPAPAVTVAVTRLERAMASPAALARIGEGDRIDVPLVARGVSAESSLVVTSRAALDRGLLDAACRAGATLVAERVIDVAAEAGGVVVRTRRATYRAGMLIGADGPGSLVRRRLARAFSRAQLSVGAGYFVSGASSREIVIRWVADPPGYLWSFPRPDHLAVGICAQGDAGVGVEQLHRHAADWLAAAALAPSPAGLTPYAWPIPSLDAADLARPLPGGDRWLLLGDAAGLVDPLTREGIFYALLSGDLAASALAGDAAGADGYRARVAETILPELRRAAVLKRGFFGAEFSRLVVSALADSAAVRDVMVDLLGGRQPYVGLRRRLLGTLELGLAWRALRTGWGCA
jgi:geranylgeranyl reductase family protein